MDSVSRTSSCRFPYPNRSGIAPPTAEESDVVGIMSMRLARHIRIGVGSAPRQWRIPRSAVSPIQLGAGSGALICRRSMAHDHDPSPGAIAEFHKPYGNSAGNPVKTAALGIGDAAKLRGNRGRTTGSAGGGATGEGSRPRIYPDPHLGSVGIIPPPATDGASGAGSWSFSCRAQ